MTTVAVIQPYFVPYAGYFRLFAAADVVVMFDCVQFPRRGWVHRNRVPVSADAVAWFTLPIAKASRDVVISDLRFPGDARERLAAAMRRFPVLQRAHAENHPLTARLLELGGDAVTPYLVELLREISSGLGLERPLIRSSTLNVPADIKGEERVIAIVAALGGTRYVNPSGGRELYHHDVFGSAGLELAFLPPYAGSMASILVRLLEEPPASIRAEIDRETILCA